jgi:hypothetical protein
MDLNQRTNHRNKYYEQRVISTVCTHCNEEWARDEDTPGPTIEQHSSTWRSKESIIQVDIYLLVVTCEVEVQVETRPPLSRGVGTRHR